MVPLPGPGASYGIWITRPRYIGWDIQEWWYENVDHLVLQQEKLRHKDQDWIREEVLYVELAYDQYEIFWGKFLKELEHWLTQHQRK